MINFQYTKDTKPSQEPMKVLSRCLKSGRSNFNPTNKSHRLFRLNGHLKDGSVTNCHFSYVRITVHQMACGGCVQLIINIKPTIAPTYRNIMNIMFCSSYRLLNLVANPYCCREKLNIVQTNSSENIFNSSWNFIFMTKYLPVCKMIVIMGE